MAKKTESKTSVKTSNKSTSFVQKYGVDEARIYKGNADSLQIPPPGHPLHDPTAPTKFDELRVAEIDKDGKMTVDQTKVHKVPELKGGQWIQVPRYEWKDVGNSHVVP